MNERVTVYCDESGNDGPNYLNKDSPFYVLAGWVVPDESIVDAAVAIEQLRQAGFQKGTTELKYRLFDRNDWRRKALVEIISKLGKLRLTPVYLIAEKRYCVAGKIVETFLDPWYNDLAKNGMTWNVVVKQEIANTFYNCLPDSTLERFARAYRDPTQADLGEALAEVEADCHRYINPELAKFVHGSHAKLDEIAAAEIKANATWGKGGGTLNLPCLIAFVMMIEQMGRSGLFVTNKIVHDELHAYEDTYKAAFLYCKNGYSFWMTLPGSELGHGSVLTVDTFEIQRSVDQPLIQAADLLSGAINSLCISLVKGADLTPHELEISQYVLTPMLFREHKIAFPICSDKMLTLIGEAIRKTFQELSSAAGPLPYDKSHARGLPLLPSNKQDRPVVRSDRPKLKIDLPLYGIICEENSRLIAISYSEPGDVPGAEGPVIPLFTKQSHADEFLAEMQPRWEEPHRVHCFGPLELNDLLTRLNKMAEIADVIEIDSRGLIKTREVIEGLDNVRLRTLMAIQTGAMNVLMERHSIDGVEIVSLLLSSGEYGAMQDGGGEVFRASSREEAIKAVIAASSGRNATLPGT
jgi:hypothetical protein